MQKSLISICLLSAALTACVPTMNQSGVSQHWNIPTTGQAMFDNEKYIRLSNVSCGNVFLDLYQDAAKEKNGHILISAGIHSINNIGDGRSLQFKVDGKKHSFTPTSVVTEHGNAYYGENSLINDKIPFSYKNYSVPTSFIKKAAQAQEVVARIYLLNDNYIDGKCSALTLTEAKNRAGKYSNHINTDNLGDMNSTAATIGFQKFVIMMNENF